MDQLAAKQFGITEQQAAAYIMEGRVWMGFVPADKPGTTVKEDTVLTLKEKAKKYASRSGYKLEKALDCFSLDVTGLHVCDIGASNGGFTDCLLKRNAKKVYAVDSGSGQLDPDLVADERVVNIENYNARNLSKEDLTELCDIAVTDVSFISQTLIIPAVIKVLKKNGIYISLIKPQFECGKSAIGKGGIVKDKKIMADCITKVITCALQNGLGCKGVIRSPIDGGDGNAEFLMYCVLGEDSCIDEKTVKEVVGI